MDTSDCFEKDFMLRIEDSLAYDAGGNKSFYTCLTRSALIKIRDAVNKTIETYDELGWTDKDVHNRNYELYEAWREKVKQETKSPKPKAKKESPDYLYLIHDTVQNTLKIGITRNPKNRFRNIQLATSNKLVMLYALKGKAHLEKELHKEFAEIRLASEWFKYDDRIIERYKNL